MKSNLPGAGASIGKSKSAIAEKRRVAAVLVAAVAIVGIVIGKVDAASPGQTPQSTQLPGHIWHSFHDLDNPRGTFILDPNTGVQVTADEKEWGVPWPEGLHFIRHEYIAGGSSGDETHMWIRRTGSDKTVAERKLDGDFNDMTPAPRSPWILSSWATTTFGDRRGLVFDLAKGKILLSTEESKRPDAYAWMPDETLLRATPAGEISKVVLGGKEQRIGTVKWPESRFPQAIYVSPDGTRLLAQLAALRDTGSVSGVDLWLMNIDGSNVTRFTKNDLISNAFWSPDGRYIAFTKDTGTSCTSFTCRGSCTVWYAPASASNVVAVPASNDAKRFPLKRPNGSMTTVGCAMMAWTK